MSEILDRLQKFVDVGLPRLVERTQAGYVLLCAALIDEQLSIEIRTQMVPLTKALDRRIFEGYGPLSTTASRIDLSRALGIVDESVYDKLCILNKIRVAFAHPREEVSLNSEKLSELFRRFVPEAANERNLLDVFLEEIERLMTAINPDLIRRLPSTAFYTE